MKMILLAALVATPCMAADQFDLVCSGTRVFHDPLAPKAISLPYMAEVRIDLKADRYCYGDCQRTRMIAKIDGNLIALETPDVARTTDIAVEDTTIDRHTYSYTSEVTAVAPDRQQTSIKASCKIVPFRPFPVSDAQF